MYPFPQSKPPLPVFRAFLRGPTIVSYLHHPHLPLTSLFLSSHTGYGCNDGTGRFRSSERKAYDR